MPDLTSATALQVVLALGLLNVWLLRAATPTRYRGGDARTLRDEFRAYSLPTWFFFLVGALKVASALGLLAGLWLPALVLPTAGMLVALMLGALAMHARVRDPAIKSLPAFLMLVMGAALIALRLY